MDKLYIIEPETLPIKEINISVLSQTQENLIDP